MHSLLFFYKYFLRNCAIWPRFVFDWYFLSRNPGTKIKEPGTSSLFVFLHLLPELQISCVFAFFTLWKRVKMHALSDQSVHIMHTYCCVSKLSKFGAYITIHFCLWEIPRNYFPLYFSKERAYTSEGVPNAYLSKHRCQKRSDWMLTTNHRITVNITNKCGLRNK
jgi:hypothetical protein